MVIVFNKNSIYIEFCELFGGGVYNNENKNIYLLYKMKKNTFSRKYKKTLDKRGGKRRSKKRTVSKVKKIKGGEGNLERALRAAQIRYPPPQGQSYSDKGRWHRH